MAVKREVITYQVEYICDVEGCNGEVKWEQVTLLSYPPQYPHRCKKCGKDYTFRGKHYPYIRTELTL